jgi:hypothetical protein
MEQVETTEVLEKRKWPQTKNITSPSIKNTWFGEKLHRFIAIIIGFYFPAIPVSYSPPIPTRWFGYSPAISGGWLWQLLAFTRSQKAFCTEGKRDGVSGNWQSAKHFKDGKWDTHELPGHFRCSLRWDAWWGLPKFLLSLGSSAALHRSLSGPENSKGENEWRHMAAMLQRSNRVFSSNGHVSYL